MSAKLMGQVFECDVTGSEQLVLLALADHGKDDGSRIYPSLDFVAWKVGLTRRHVRRIVSSLRERGVLVVRRGATRYEPTRYRMDLSKLPRKEPLREDRVVSPRGARPPGRACGHPREDIRAPQGGQSYVRQGGHSCVPRTTSEP